MFFLVLTHFVYFVRGYCSHQRMLSYWPNLRRVERRTYREEYDRVMTEYNEIQLAMGNLDNLQPLDLTSEELLSEDTVALYERIVRRERRQSEGEPLPREEVLSDEDDSQLMNSYLEKDRKPENEDEDSSTLNEGKGQTEEDEQENTVGNSDLNLSGDVKNASNKSQAGSAAAGQTPEAPNPARSD